MCGWGMNCGGQSFPWGIFSGSSSLYFLFWYFTLLSIYFLSYLAQSQFALPRVPIPSCKLSLAQTGKTFDALGRRGRPLTRRGRSDLVDDVDDEKKWTDGTDKSPNTFFCALRFPAGRVGVFRERTTTPPRVGTPVRFAAARSVPAPTNSKNCPIGWDKRGIQRIRSYLTHTTGVFFFQSSLFLSAFDLIVPVLTCCLCLLAICPRTPSSCTPRFVHHSFNPVALMLDSAWHSAFQFRAPSLPHTRTQSCPRQHHRHHQW